jgi:glyoxylase-like metal-dependent hydrolase (beta-lactamase superfamily II)
MMINLEENSKVQPINLGHYNIYLIQTDNGYILVDTGMPNINKKLDEAFQKYGVDPKRIQLIILTHGHMDHVGSVAYIKKITGGKVLCHRSFSKDLGAGKIEVAVPKNFLGRFFHFMTGFLGSKIEGVIPDILLDDEFDLSEYGVSGKIIHTPGHSQSSISIVLDNGEALVGDLIREVKPGVVGLGMFYEDKKTALESLKKIAACDPRIIYLSHSDTIDNRELNDFIAVNQ